MLTQVTRASREPPRAARRVTRSARCNVLRTGSLRPRGLSDYRHRSGAHASCNYTKGNLFKNVFNPDTDYYKYVLKF